MKHIATFISAIGMVMLVASPAWSGDNLPDPQDPGEHSTIVTSDGSIRDDELAEWVAQNLPKAPDGTPLCSDVKVLFNTCYGGGFLDDFARVFGTGGTAAGTRWVGGSAAGADECAWCPVDEDVAGTNQGGFWTDELMPEVTTGSNVATGIGVANILDPVGAYGSGDETGQTAWGNGGENVAWSSSAEVVIFAGQPDYAADDNDVENMEDNMLDRLDDDSNIYSSGSGFRSTNDLKSMIQQACQNLGSGEQLVLYFSDHGDTHFDLGEWWAHRFGGGFVMADPATGGGVDFPLHVGWMHGLSVMDGLAGQTAEPFIEVTPLGFMDNDQWTLLLNGVIVPFDDIPPGVTAEIDVDW